MSTPFEVLGLRAWADPDEIRAAYRSLVKQCHPDMVQDPAQKQIAQERMIQLNLAYEEALRLATPRQHAAYTQELPACDAVILAEKMLNKGNPESALRQLNRADRKDAAWHNMHGKILMNTGRYQEAHEAFREAVRLDPDNREYRAGALDAAVQVKKESTFAGKVRKWFRKN